MWHKWVFISTLVALTCLMRGTVGEVNAVAGGADLASALISETAAVAEAAGHPVTGAELAFTTSTVTSPGSPLTPSLYRDLVAGAPTEADHVLTDLTLRARALGVATPCWTSPPSSSASTSTGSPRDAPETLGARESPRPHPRGTAVRAHPDAPPVGHPGEPGL